MPTSCCEIERRRGVGAPSTGRCRTAAGCCTAPAGTPARRSQEDFLNADDSGPHTPGISPECARWIAEESPVIGVGTETVGTDAGAAHSFDPAVPVPLLPDGQRQVRADPAAEPRPPPRDRRGRSSPGRCRSSPARAARPACSPSSSGDEGRRRPSGGRWPRSASGRPSASSGRATSTSPTRWSHAGVPFVAARHEGGAATMADAYSRMSGTVAALSVHQGCGLTNAMTGITEAAKSRTPMLVLAAEATNPLSNFHVDQPALAARRRRRVDAGRVRRDRRRRRRRGVLDRPPRPAHRRAQPAARRAGPRGAGRRRATCPAHPTRPRRRPDADGVARARRGARPAPSGRSSSPAAGRAATVAARRSRRSPTRSGALAGHERRRQRPVPRQPVVARDLRRVRVAARRRADPRRRPDRRRGAAP